MINPLKLHNRETTFLKKTKRILDKTALSAIIIGSIVLPVRKNVADLLAETPDRYKQTATALSDKTSGSKEEKSTDANFLTVLRDIKKQIALRDKQELMSAFADVPIQDYWKEFQHYLSSYRNSPAGSAILDNFADQNLNERQFKQMHKILFDILFIEENLRPYRKMENPQYCPTEHLQPWHSCDMQDFFSKRVLFAKDYEKAINSLKRSLGYISSDFLDQHIKNFNGSENAGVFNRLLGRDAFSDVLSRAYRKGAKHLLFQRMAESWIREKIALFQIELAKMKLSETVSAYETDRDNDVFSKNLDSIIVALSDAKNELTLAKKLFTHELAQDLESSYEDYEVKKRVYSDGKEADVLISLQERANQAELRLSSQQSPLLHYFGNQNIDERLIETEKIFQTIVNLKDTISAQTREGKDALEKSESSISIPVQFGDTLSGILFKLFPGIPRDKTSYEEIRAINSWLNDKYTLNQGNNLKIPLELIKKNSSKTARIFAWRQKEQKSQEQEDFASKSLTNKELQERAFNDWSESKNRRLKLKSDLALLDSRIQQMLAKQAPQQAGLYHKIKKESGIFGKLADSFKSAFGFGKVDTTFNPSAARKKHVADMDMPEEYIKSLNDKVFSVDPPLGGYFREDVREEFDFSSASWRVDTDNLIVNSDSRNYNRFNFTTENGGHKLSGVIEDGIAMIPIKYGYAIDTDSIELNKPAKSRILRDSNGRFYLQLDRNDAVEFSVKIALADVQIDDYSLLHFKKAKDFDVSVLQEDIRQMLKDARDITDVKERVFYILYFIKSHFEYSLDKEISDYYKENPQLYFQRIDEIRKVDCDTAATYAIMLMRRANITCRLALGFMSDGINTDVLVKHAHGWIEYYYEDEWNIAEAAPPDRDGDARRILGDLNRIPQTIPELDELLFQKAQIELEEKRLAQREKKLAQQAFRANKMPVLLEGKAPIELASESRVKLEETSRQFEKECSEKIKSGNEYFKNYISQELEKAKLAYLENRGSEFLFYPYFEHLLKMYGTSLRFCSDQDLRAQLTADLREFYDQGIALMDSLKLPDDVVEMHSVLGVDNEGRYMYELHPTKGIYVIDLTEPIPTARLIYDFLKNTQYEKFDTELILGKLLLADGKNFLALLGDGNDNKTLVGTYKEFSLLYGKKFHLIQNIFEKYQLLADIHDPYLFISYEVGADGMSLLSNIPGLKHYEGKKFWNIGELYAIFDEDKNIKHWALPVWENANDVFFISSISELENHRFSNCYYEFGEQEFKTTNLWEQNGVYLSSVLTRNTANTLIMGECPKSEEEEAKEFEEFKKKGGGIFVTGPHPIKWPFQNDIHTVISNIPEFSDISLYLFSDVQIHTFDGSPNTKHSQNSEIMLTNVDGASFPFNHTMPYTLFVFEESSENTLDKNLLNYALIQNGKVFGPIAIPNTKKLLKVHISNTGEFIIVPKQFDQGVMASTALVNLFYPEITKKILLGLPLTAIIHRISDIEIHEFGDNQWTLSITIGIQKEFSNPDSIFDTTYFLTNVPELQGCTNCTTIKPISDKQSKKYYFSFPDTSEATINMLSAAHSVEYGITPQKIISDFDELANISGKPFFDAVLLNTSDLKSRLFAGIEIGSDEGGAYRRLVLRGTINNLSFFELDGKKIPQGAISKDGTYWHESINNDPAIRIGPGAISDDGKYWCLSVMEENDQWKLIGNVPNRDIYEHIKENTPEELFPYLPQNFEIKIVNEKWLVEDRLNNRTYIGDPDIPSYGVEGIDLIADGKLFIKEDGSFGLIDKEYGSLYGNMLSGINQYANRSSLDIKWGKLDVKNKDFWSIKYPQSVTTGGEWQNLHYISTDKRQKYFLFLLEQELLPQLFVTEQGLVDETKVEEFYKSARNILNSPKLKPSVNSLMGIANHIGLARYLKKSREELTEEKLPENLMGNDLLARCIEKLSLSKYMAEIRFADSELFGNSLAQIFPEFESTTSEPVIKVKNTILQGLLKSPVSLAHFLVQRWHDVELDSYILQNAQAFRSDQFQQAFTSAISAKYNKEFSPRHHSVSRNDLGMKRFKEFVVLAKKQGLVINSSLPDGLRDEEKGW